MKSTRSYLINHRLSDILALIQVLALDKHGHRGEEGLQKELNGKPKSGESWFELARQHHEFFRAEGNRDHGISLISRHVIDKNENGIRELSPDFTKKLLETAIELHDRQKQQSDWWKVWLPVIAVVTAGLINVLVTISTSKEQENKEKLITIQFGADSKPN